ncbi:hypothetical protein FDP22_23095 (plasmid) [Paroceanicella profunda]|uniref:Tetratricopeptide repeat protein n=1 Tax=Paroceanicella profunda TaxID=2579971 RepID=A0A5B8G5V0_9RHOB|nr:hypothetical protein [Paroceanicella profunda]QDL94762.1 hypothetical protein FDP22_23095 [Paroceanicella profunda]
MSVQVRSGHGPAPSPGPQAAGLRARAAALAWSVLLPALVLCALILPAAAQAPLLLRAGDQSRMSRLVLDLPPGTPWSTDQDGRTVMVRFPGIALDFDTRAIFPDRRASRVLSAQVRNEVTGTILFLTLACDCTAESFALGPRKLIIDVRDRTSPKDAAEAPRAPEGRVEGNVAAEAPSREAPPAGAAPAARTAAAPEAQAPAGTAPSAQAPAPPPPAGAAPPADPAAALAHAPDGDVPVPTPMPRPETRPALKGDDLAAIEAARSRLMEKLARAAEQGLVEFRTPEAGAEAAEGQAPSAAAAAEAEPGMPEETAGADGADQPADAAQATEGPAAAPSPEDGPALTVTTARERDRAADTEGAAPPPPYCLPEEALDITSWASSEPVVTQIAEARAGLIGEFDRPDPEAVSRLVRLYIHYGFGLEAQDLLDNMGTQIPRSALLRDLARVVEGGTPLPDGPLALQVGCPGRAGFWGLLAATDPETGTVPPGIPVPDTTTLRDVFSEFPAVPRRLLGPRMALGLLDLGREADAGLVLSLTAVHPGDPGDAYEYARAKLLEAQGAPEAAEVIYRQLIDDNRPNAPAAMIALTESRLQRGLPPPGAMAADLAGQARQVRRTEQGRRLEAAEIEARAASGELDRALRLIADDLAETPGRGAELREAAARVLARSRAPEADPASYAAAVLAHRTLLSEGPEADPARLIVADELTRIGLPNAALDILGPTLSRGAPEARLAAARAHDLLGESTPTLDLLEGMAGPDVARLRAAALARRQDYAGARIALAGAGDRQREATLAFAAGDWAAALEAPDPVARTMAAYMAGLGPEAANLPGAADVAAPLAAFLATPVPEDEISLAGARQTIDLSRSARALITETLGLPPPAQAPGG